METIGFTVFEMEMYFRIFEKIYLIIIQMTIDYMGDSVNSVSFTPDGNCILAGAMGGVVRLMDKNSGKLLARYGITWISILLLYIKT